MGCGHIYQQARDLVKTPKLSMFERE
jgi:hypothetical protein